MIKLQHILSHNMHYCDSDRETASVLKLFHQLIILPDKNVPYIESELVKPHFPALDSLTTFCLRYCCIFSPVDIFITV